MLVAHLCISLGLSLLYLLYSTYVWCENENADNQFPFKPYCNMVSEPNLLT